MKCLFKRYDSRNKKKLNSFLSERNETRFARQRQENPEQCSIHLQHYFGVLLCLQVIAYEQFLDLHNWLSLFILTDLDRTVFPGFPHQGSYPVFRLHDPETCWSLTAISLSIVSTKYICTCVL